MALGLIQPLTLMSTGNISWGKGGRCVGLTALPPLYTECLEISETQPPGALRTCTGLEWDCFILRCSITLRTVMPNITRGNFQSIAATYVLD
jgi:hypothetical protein